MPPVGTIERKVHEIGCRNVGLDVNQVQYGVSPNPGFSGVEKRSLRRIINAPNLNPRLASLLQSTH